MKLFFSLLLAFGALLSWANVGLTQSLKPATDDAGDSEPFALVELFTSQGCSSCPPADAVLRQIVTGAHQDQLRIHVLSFHVDYWNRLGWNDPHSDPKYSARQRAYAAASGSRRVYTPQMIVSGTTEFVGSHRGKATAAIAASLRRKPQSTIRLSVTRKSSSEQTLEVAYRVRGKTKGQVLNLAAVEPFAENSVPRGENAGRSLQHVNVVRSFRIIRLNVPEGQVEWNLPEDLKDDRLRVIAYVQDPKELSIHGVTTLEL